MPVSRLTRLEEKRTKKRLIWLIMGITIFAILTIILGIPLMVRLSLFAGNIDSNPTTNDTEDTTPPYPPVLTPVTNATNSAQIRIDGYAEPETILKIFLNGLSIKEMILGKDGNFSFDDITLERGQNDMYGVSIDQANNESMPSQTISIIFKKDGPKLEIQEPLEGQVYSKEQQVIKINGKTDPRSTVWVNDRFVSVNDTGNFQYSLKLNSGENTLVIIAKDEAGNETKLERKVIYNE